MERDPDTDEIVYDRKGKDSSLRIGVNLGDSVIISNFRERVKEFGTEKSEKELDASAQESRKKDLLMHDTDEDVMALGTQLVKSGSAGNCFVGNNFEVDLGSLQKDVAEQMGSDDDDQEEKASETPAASERESEDGTKAGPKSKGSGKAKSKAEPKRKKWDKSSTVAAKIRTETTALCTLEVQLQRRLSECRHCLTEVATKGQACNDETKIEKATLDKRVGFLEAVLGQEQEKLNGLIDQYKLQADEKSQPRDGSAPTLATSWHSQLDVAPPCEKFQELKTLASFAETVEELWQSSNAAELKDQCKRRSEARRPITELSWLERTAQSHGQLRPAGQGQGRIRYIQEGSFNGFNGILSLGEGTRGCHACPRDCCCRPRFHERLLPCSGEAHGCRAGGAGNRTPAHE